jgi:hypothetical protein
VKVVLTEEVFSTNETVDAVLTRKGLSIASFKSTFGGSSMKVEEADNETTKSDSTVTKRTKGLHHKSTSLSHAVEAATAAIAARSTVTKGTVASSYVDLVHKAKPKKSAPLHKTV